MKKKAMIIIGAVVILAIVAAFLFGQGGDVSVVSNPDNTVVMTAKGSGANSTATGAIIVRDGEHPHLEYELEKGSFDIALSIPDHDFFSISDIKGSGTEDFEDDGNFSGEYTVIFTLHGATGTATLSTRK